MRNKKIGVVIVTFNNSYDTLKTASSVLSSDYGGDIKVLIIDNGSDPAYKKTLQDEFNIRFPESEILYLEHDSGYGGACNYGAKYLLKRGSDLLVFLNNDVILAKKCLVYLSTNFEDGKIAIAGPKVYLGSSDIIYSAGGFFDKRFLTVTNRGNGELDYGQYNRREEVDFINGCALMMPAEIFARLEGFDERFHYYAEEADLCYRAYKNGYKLIYDPRAIVYHWANKTAGSQSKKIFYYVARNRLYFVHKHKSRNKFIVLYNLIWIFYYYIAKPAIAQLGQSAVGGIAVFRGIKDFIIGKTGAGPYK